MDITPKTTEDTHLIRSYGIDGIMVNDTCYRSPIIVLPEAVYALEMQDDVLTSEASYQPLIDAHNCGFVLVGTGATSQWITPAFRRHMKETHGLQMEVMDTGAACRTYNVLIAEARPVAALLMPVQPESIT